MKGDAFLAGKVLSLERSNPVDDDDQAGHLYASHFVNFYSYLLIFPYKISWCSSSKRFIITTSKCRKILCYFSQSIAILANTPYLVGFLYHLYQGWTRPTLLLTSCTNLLCILTTIDFLRMLWLKSELILEVANWHLKMEIINQVPLYKAGWLCAFPFIPLILDNPVATTFNELLGAMSHTGLSSNFSFYSSQTNFLGPFYCPFYVLLLYGHLYYMTSTGFVLTLVLTIRESLLQLHKSKNLTERNVDLALYQGVRTESELRTLMTTTNAVIGSKIFLEYLLMLSFYATILEFFDWTYDGSLLRKTHVLLYLFFSGAFWIWACEVHYLIRNYLKNWAQYFRCSFLLESPEKLKQYHASLLALQIEADLNPACISCQCFNVTYGFLGSMFGLIITYSTITYQMKSDKN